MTKASMTLLYTVNDVAKKLGVSADTIRNWERRNLVRCSYTTPTSIRLYTEEDIKLAREHLYRTHMYGLWRPNDEITGGN
jgi:DNA-binding transcriptional MerR regulator